MPKEPEPGFCARFLGGFFLEFKGERIIITKNMKQKSMQILLILLKAGREGVTRRDLIGMLEWGGDSWEKKLNNLRRQTCNLRKAISEAGFPEGEYIQAKKGRYYFSFEYDVETDTGKIDRLYREARRKAGRIPMGDLQALPGRIPAVFGGGGMGAGGKCPLPFGVLPVCK